MKIGFIDLGVAYEGRHQLRKISTGRLSFAQETG